LERNTLDSIGYVLICISGIILALFCVLFAGAAISFLIVFFADPDKLIRLAYVLWSVNLYAVSLWAMLNFRPSEWDGRFLRRRRRTELHYLRPRGREDD